MKSGHWVEVDGTFLMQEFVGLEEAEGGLHSWRGLEWWTGMWTSRWDRHVKNRVLLQVNIRHKKYLSTKRT